MRIPTFSRHGLNHQAWSVFQDRHPDDDSVIVVSLRWFDYVEDTVRWTVIGWTDTEPKANHASLQIANRMAFSGGFPVVLREDRVLLDIDAQSFGLNHFSNNPDLLPPLVPGLLDYLNEDNTGGVA